VTFATATSLKKASSNKEVIVTRSPSTPKRASNRENVGETMRKLFKQPMHQPVLKPTCSKLFTPTTSHPLVLKPTCSKMFKQSSNSESAGSVAAYLAMREHQK